MIILAEDLMNVKNKRLQRREFLKKVAQTSTGMAGLPLVLALGNSGCSILDRYFEIEKYKYDQEVLIFGAGLAGLSTAFYLKKDKIPYRLFEASQRTGGRILTQHTNQEKIFSDIGAFEFDEFDSLVLELIKDLKLEVDEDSQFETLFKNDFTFFYKQKFITFKQILLAEHPHFQRWNKELTRLKKDQDTENTNSWLTDSLVYEYTQISLLDLFKDAKLQEINRQLLLNWAEFSLQKKAKDISYLEWLLLLDNETLSNKKIRIKFGMEELITHLSQRVSGVIPNYNLQLPAKLVSISRENDVWKCGVSTSDGLKTYFSPYVVLAIPFLQLKKIKGLETILVNNEYKEVIQQATAKKSVVAMGNIKPSFYKKNSHIKDLLIVDERVCRVRVIANKMRVHFNGMEEFEWFLKNKSNALNNSLLDGTFESSFDWGQVRYIEGAELSLTSKQIVDLKSAFEANWQESSLQFAGDYIVNPFKSKINDVLLSSHQAVENLKWQIKKNMKDNV